jgi:hypothetical protein
MKSLDNKGRLYSIAYEAFNNSMARIRSKLSKTRKALVAFAPMLT